MVALDKCKKNGIINYGVIRETCELYKKSLNVKTPSINTVIQNLSGGNQQKVIIAKWLFRDCDILLIDEPTPVSYTHLDVYKRQGKICNRCL